MASSPSTITEERFEFTGSAKKSLAMFGAVGLVILVLGIVFAATGSHAEEHAAGEGHAFHWTQRLFANLWINNIYFLGIALVGVLFVALQYVAQAGWSASMKRVPEAFGNWIPVGGLLILAVFIIANHDLFHWTHGYLYDEADPRYDHIIDGKKGYFFWPLSENPSIPVFFLVRMVAYFVVWYLLFSMIRKASLKEDLEGGTKNYYRMVTLSAIFTVVFGLTSSTAAWDWVLSIDTHWFSTMFGWYVFASWFVSGLAAITLAVVLLREQGYLQMISSEHFHDLGKFIFAFSIFWTYIWFSQYLLIYYANIPEETIYFVERLASDHYGPILIINLILNFALPFLVLMTRDSKRISVFLKIVCVVVLLGHWLDFYLMITPGTLKENGAFGLMEIGSFILYSTAFIFVVMLGWTKASLVPVNHPMLEESVHHHT
jgi:hypothetical protein